MSSDSDNINSDSDESSLDSTEREITDNPIIVDDQIFSSEDEIDMENTLFKIQREILTCILDTSSQTIDSKLLNMSLITEIKIYDKINFFLKRYNRITHNCICNSLMSGKMDSKILKNICPLIDVTNSNLGNKYLNTLSYMLKVYGREYTGHRVFCNNEKMYSLIDFVLKLLINKIPEKLCKYESRMCPPIIISILCGSGKDRDNFLTSILDIYEKYRIQLPCIKNSNYKNVKATVLYLAITHSGLDVIKRIIKFEGTKENKTRFSKPIFKPKSLDIGIFLEPIFASTLTNLSPDNKNDVKRAISIFNLLIDSGFNPFISIICKKSINEKYSIFYFIEHHGWKNTEIYDIVVNYRTNLILSLVMNKKELAHILLLPTLKNIIKYYF